MYQFKLKRNEKRKNVVFLMISILFISNTATAQEEETIDDVSKITGIYMGIEDGTYSFSFKDNDGEQSTLNFDQISPEAKKMIDLNDKKMIGQLFTVTFSNENKEEEDEDGETTYTSVKTILTIEKVKK